MDSLGGMMGGATGAGGTGGGFWGGLANAASSFNTNYNASKGGGSPIGAPMSKNQQTAANPELAEFEELMKKYFPQQTVGTKIDYTATKPTGSSGRAPIQFEP